MRILLVNPPHTAIGSRIPKENLPPHGLLSIGGPLIDAGHDVRLLNGDRGPLGFGEIMAKIAYHCADAVLIGHSGSTSAHPVSMEIATAIKRQLPKTLVIYGGVFPTYHWNDILTPDGPIDIIVRGEGEATVVTLIDAVTKQRDLAEVDGIAYRKDGRALATKPAEMIKSLDRYRTGWELIDFADYSYWGGKQAVVMQFSRGCPHLCTYCGQRGFWTKWRHRDPVKFAAEIAWLYREHGVELINLADENPTSSRRAWRQFLEAMIAENVPVTIIGSTRAGDIVRDADLLHLYKKAGVLRFLLGMENTNEETLKAIKKGSTSSQDKQAIALLRQHDIISLCTWVVGFEEETDCDYWQLFKQLCAYDPDQIVSMFATPHRWTPFYRESKNRKILRHDLRQWDYKHQVMAVSSVPAWRVFMWTKLIEVAVQARPRALWRVLAHRDKEVRKGMQWYTTIGRRVWLHEIWDFIIDYPSMHRPKLLRQFWGDGETIQENALSRQAVRVDTKPLNPLAGHIDFSTSPAETSKNVPQVRLRKSA
jgi:anaerobic magnesium-protoporphyrin IX monomethyl ester cyclase